MSFSVLCSYMIYNYNIYNYLITDVILLSCLITYVTIMHDVISHLSPKSKEKKSKSINRIKGKINKTKFIIYNSNIDSGLKRISLAMLRWLIDHLKTKYLVGITRELNKEFLMYSYTIYTTNTSPTLNYICLHKSTILLLQDKYTTTMSLMSFFYYILDLWYHIIWCIMWLWSCASSLSKKKNKRKIKSRKIDNRKRKSK